MNTISVINLNTLEQSINSSEYLPLTQNKNFYNFKKRMIFQIYIPCCAVIRNETFNTVKMLIDDETLNTLLLLPIEQHLQHNVGFRSVVRKKGVYVKLCDSTIIQNTTFKSIQDLGTTLYGATALISVNLYSINNESCGLTLRCDRLKFLSSTNNISTVPEFIPDNAL